ncbi:hypothetical protein RI367_000773 [Sorochytrium milnesiophthora]
MGKEKFREDRKNAQSESLSRKDVGKAERELAKLQQLEKAGELGEDGAKKMQDLQSKLGAYNQEREAQARIIRERAKAPAEGSGALFDPLADYHKQMHAAQALQMVDYSSSDDSGSGADSADGEAHRDSSDAEMSDEDPIVRDADAMPPLPDGPLPGRHKAPPYEPEVSFGYGYPPLPPGPLPQHPPQRPPYQPPAAQPLLVPNVSGMPAFSSYPPHPPPPPFLPPGMAFPPPMPPYAFAQNSLPPAALPHMPPLAVGMVPPPPAFALPYPRPPPAPQPQTAQSAVISAAPVIRDLKREVTKFVPASVRAKQKAPATTARVSALPAPVKSQANEAPSAGLAPAASATTAAPAAAHQEQLEDTYDAFLKEMEGLI